MKGCQYRCDVERFVAIETPAGPQLELDGWVVSDAAIAAVRLLCAGRSVAVAANPQADDADNRLLLMLREAVVGDPADASLEIEIANGDMLAFDIGHLYRPPGWRPAVIDLQAAAEEGDLTIDVPDAAALAEALVDEFAALDHDEDLMLHPGDGGLIATSHRYGLRFHAAVDRHADRERARDRARSAGRRLRERLRHTVPMLVHRATVFDNDDTARALATALRARNPDAVLLWLEPGPPSGDVVRCRAGNMEPPDPGLLLASTRDPWDLVLDRARDRLVSPR